MTLVIRPAQRGTLDPGGEVRGTTDLRSFDPTCCCDRTISEGAAQASHGSTAMTGVGRLAELAADPRCDGHIATVRTQTN